jgi:hypothetical protein
VRAGRVVAALAALILLAPATARAQGAQSAFSVGPRLGFEFALQAVVAGGFARLGIPGTPFELQSVGDLTFGRITDRQLTVDLLYRASPGLYLGAGPVFWNSRFGTGAELGARETRTGWSLFVTLGTGVEAGRSIMSGLELRWVFLDAYRPRTLVGQLGIPLIRF